MEVKPSVKKALEENINGKRSIGHCRQRWTVRVNDDLKQVGTKSNNNRQYGQYRWRNVVEAAKGP